MYKIGTGSAGEYNSILRNYKVPVIPGADPEKVRARNFRKQADMVPTVEADTEALSAVTRSQESRFQTDILRKNTGLEDISLTFNRQEGFGYIGRDSDIHSLDVEKAIDDMKKDKVLQQYQYFVGSSRNLYEAEDVDGTVIQKL